MRRVVLAAAMAACGRYDFDAHDGTWFVGDFDACGASTSGMKMRIVECHADDGAALPDAYCLDDKPSTTRACACVDIDWRVHELPGDGVTTCGAPLRYMIESDTASRLQRCSELGYADYGSSYIEFTTAEWCYYCNALTKRWDGSAWVSTGCNVGVNILTCCMVL